MLFHLLNVITAYKPNQFSKKIKKETKEKHDKIERHTLFRDMISGELHDFKYAVYLTNLMPIYNGVEMFLFKNNNNNDIVQTKKIDRDLENYKRLLNFNFNDSSLMFYNSWLTYFFSKDDFYKKTELYTRWLADMYGGQIIKRNIKFNSKYEFTNLRENIKFIRKLIEQDLDSSNVDKFIEEVNKTYDFHKDLADKIEEINVKNYITP